MPTFKTFTANRPLLYTSLVILTLIVAIAICEAIGWPFLRGPLINLMEEKLERTVRIDGPFKLHLLGGIRLDAGSFWISAPPEFKVPHLANATSLQLKLRYGDLLNVKDGEPYVIRSIRAQSLNAHLYRNLDGKSTWQFSKDENDPVRPFPIIQALIIGGGKAMVIDELTQTDLMVSFETNEGASNDKRLSKVALRGEFRERDISSELITYGFLPIATQTKKSAPVSSQGWLKYGKVYMDFDGSVYDLFGEQTIKGNLKVKGDSLGDLGDLLSITLPRTTAFTIDSGIERNPKGWIINIDDARVGRSQLYGHFEYDTRPERSLLKGILRGKRFVLADLAPAFGAGTTESSTANGTKNGKVRERVFPDQPLDFATYNRMNADILVDLEYVDLGRAFRAPIAPFKAKLDLNKNKLSLAEIYAKTAQGTIEGNIAIDAHQQEKTTNPQKDKDNPAIKADWGIDLAVRDINLEQWLTVSDARKENAKKKGKPEPQAYVTGQLNAKAKLNGKGNTTVEVLRSLDGNVNAHVRNGEISHLIVEALGLDIAQAVGLLMRGDHNLRMQCAVVDFKSNNGIMRSDVALIDTSVTTILVDGDINMGEEKLNLRTTAQPKNFSPFTVRSPILVSGTFLNPKVSAKPEPIAARVVGGILLGFINPLAAILPFLDPGKVSDKPMPSCNDTLSNLKAYQKSTLSKQSGTDNALSSPAISPAGPELQRKAQDALR